jgi:hypothetical protein
MTSLILYSASLLSFVPLDTLSLPPPLARSSTSPFRIFFSLPAPKLLSQLHVHLHLRFFPPRLSPSSLSSFCLLLPSCIFISVSSPRVCRLLPSPVSVCCSLRCLLASVFWVSVSVYVHTCLVSWFYHRPLPHRSTRVALSPSLPLGFVWLS